MSLLVNTQTLDVDNLMKSIAIIGQKGGTGKTTLAQILAVASEQAGVMTAGIDLDPQASLCHWSDLRGADAPVIIDTQPARLPKTLQTAKDQGIGLCVIDTAGRAEQAILAASKVADLVIIPLQPTVADLNTIPASMDIVRLAKAKRYLAIQTRVKPRGERHRETAEWLNAQTIPVCPVTLGDRVTYQDAYAQGLTPVEYDPAGKAADECRELYNFIIDLLNE
jgi:chromosome partitioning protein